MTDPVPNHVCREILAEIFSLSFKAELHLADRFLYNLKSGADGGEDGEVVDNDSDLDASSVEDHKIKVSAALAENDIPAAFALKVESIGQCQRAWYILFRLMKGWTRMPAMTRDTMSQGEQLAGPELSWRELQFIEYHLACHYVSTWAEFFKRPPLLPHRA